MDEFRLAVRRLSRRPAASIVSVVTVACAIGAAAATWSLLSAVLLHPLPVRDADTLVVPGTVMTLGVQAPAVYDGFSYPRFLRYRDSRIFERVAAEWMPPPTLLATTSPGAIPASVSVGFATFDFFDTLGIAIARGRGFTASDDRRGAPPVAVLSDRYWRQAFDGRPDVVGRGMTLAGTPVTVVGIATAGFRGVDLARAVDMYLPLHTIADVAPPTTNYFADPSHASSPTSGIRMIARIRSRAEIAKTSARLSALDPPPPTGAKPVLALTPIDQAAVPVRARAGVSQFARLLGTTVALLLLIGCGTVGMLLLIRTEARREELALCVALGGSRIRLARGIVIEGVLLALAGAVCAIPVSWWLFNSAGAFQLPGGIDIRLLDLRVARVVAAAAAGGCIASALISAIAATFALTADAAMSLRARGGTTPQLTRRRTRAALVIAQVSVAMVLSAGAGLFARSLASALRLNGTLDMGHVVTSTVSLRPYGYDTTRAAAFFDQVQERLRGNPAIESFSYGVYQGGMGGRLAIDGVPKRFPSDVWFTGIDRSYFSAMRIRVRSGREFTADDRPGAPRVAVVSASFARQLAGTADAIGRRITMPDSRTGHPPDVVEVVGVVDDVITRVSVLEPLDMYLPLDQIDSGLDRTLVVRVAGDIDPARREIMSAIKTVDPAVAPSPLLTLEERIGRQMASQRFGATVLGALGGIAILLTILGTYVLGESMAAMRMREMGIRAALGATRGQLGAIVLRETARLIGLGLMVGLGLAWLGAGTIRAFLFQVQPFDPVTIGGVAVTILALAMLVSLRPALRAARVDLSRVLREG